MALWIVGGVIAGGGSGVLAAKALRGKNSNTQSKVRRSGNGDGDNEFESGITGGMADSSQGAAEEGKGIHPAA
jgi:hypothetical protein